LPFTSLKEKEKSVHPLAVMRTAIWVSEGMGRVNRGKILIDKVHAKAESTIDKTTNKIRDNGLILYSNRMKIGNI
jgi:hypothetical protein